MGSVAKSEEGQSSPAIRISCATIPNTDSMNLIWARIFPFSTP
jgi:hypothetical protein